MSTVRRHRPYTFKKGVTVGGNLAVTGTFTPTGAIAATLELTSDTIGSASANSIRITSTDLTAGNTQLSIATEGGGSVGTGTPTADRTISIDYDGVQLYVLAATAAS